MSRDPFTPANRISSQRGDIWSIVNAAAAAADKPVVNMGQGFFSYGPVDYVLQAAKTALDRPECNQYSPTIGRPRLRNAIAKAYSPLFQRPIDPATEVTVTSGANEGMLCAFMAFLEPGDEVIVVEPFFDQYISNIQLTGAKIVYVPLTPPSNGHSANTRASDWTLDISQLAAAISPKTRMIVLNTPHNPIGKVFSRQELQAIGDLCVQHRILILSDEVYDRLYYTPFTRISTLSPEIAALTMTVGSGGKIFYATGWRIGWLVGPSNLIKHVSAAHTRICFSSVSPLQEAIAEGFERAEEYNFWTECVSDMQSRINNFVQIWDELGIPYTYPDGGYFVLVNLSKVRIPENYKFPEHVARRPRDFQLCWWLISEFGVAAIPPTEFMTEKNQELLQDWLRFAVCKDHDMLEQAKDRLRGLKAYIDV